jgi:hypothetical protein
MEFDRSGNYNNDILLDTLNSEKHSAEKFRSATVCGLKVLRQVQVLPVAPKVLVQNLTKESQLFVRTRNMRSQLLRVAQFLKSVNRIAQKCVNPWV